MKPRCIFKYITKCAINPNPPGFADCVRGMIAAYMYSRKYNYDFFICRNVHPVFQFFKNTPYFIEDTDLDVIELISPLSYEQIDVLLEQSFQINEDFSVITNAIYKTYNERKIRNDSGGSLNISRSIAEEYTLEWFGEIDQETKRFFRDVFKPSVEIEKQINHVFDHYYYIIPRRPEFNVIQLRTMELEGGLKEGSCEHFHQKIADMVQNSPDERFMLITDSPTLGKYLSKMIPDLYYWENKKGHMGVIAEDIDSIRDSVTDYFIMSRATRIYTVVDDYGNRSGFSKVVSLLYDIEYIVI